MSSPPMMLSIQEVSRTTRLDRLARAVDRVKNAGHIIHQHRDLIAGLPYEDYHRFKQSFNDVYRMRRNSCSWASSLKC